MNQYYPISTLILEARAIGVTPSDIFKNYTETVDTYEFLKSVSDKMGEDYIRQARNTIMSNTPGDIFYDIVYDFVMYKHADKKLLPAKITYINDNIEYVDGVHRAVLCMLLGIDLPVKTTQKQDTTDAYMESNFFNILSEYYSSATKSGDKSLYEERVDQTVRNALAALPRYIEKYGKGSSLFELKHRFHLSDEELIWIVNKAAQKGIINDNLKQFYIDYYKLN